jgi:hypothetical protein
MISQPINKHSTACSLRWIIVAESTVRWFIVREKQLLIPLNQRNEQVSTNQWAN